MQLQIQLIQDSFESALKTLTKIGKVLKYSRAALHWVQQHENPQGYTQVPTNLISSVQYYYIDCD